MFKKLALAAVILATTATIASAQDQIRIVGSSTVYPFVTTVSEQFGKKGKFKTPIVESTGTGGGFKLFCAGAGSDTPDLSNASRRIKPEELLNCRTNNVGEISEVKIGYDGIVIANSVKSAKFKLTLNDLFLALGRKVPSKQDPNKLVDNFYKNWNEIDPSLPKQKISVYGFPPSSGTRDTFTELALESVCVKLPAFEAAYPKSDDRKGACHQIREDGSYIEASEDGNIIVHKLDANKDLLGIIGFSFLQSNPNLIQASSINGVVPTHETVSNASYVLSRPLFVYVKRAHIGKVGGIVEFLTELTSDDAIGEFGYLADKGLIQMPAAELKQVQADVKSGKTLENLAEESTAKPAPAKKTK